jgi:2-polyprenyl-3-methyl-5-hydroxy-6-metoxy-1,4-benzoquinol methylase
MTHDHESNRDARVTEEVNIAIARAIGRPRTVLDFGCGAGVNGAIARDAGATVLGLDDSPAAISEARRLLDEAVQVDLDDLAAVERVLGDRSFDLVLVSDALGRVRDVHATLALLAKHLEPEGRLIASVANAAAWPVRLGLATPGLGYAPPEDSERMLRRAELVEMLRSVDLEVLGVEQNPMLARAARGIVVAGDWLAPSPSVSHNRAMRELDVYRAYRALVRPVEDAVASILPELLAYQHVAIARRRPRPGKLSLTVGMLTMNEEESVARMMDEIRKYAPDAQVLVIDSSMKDRTPEIAEQMGARVIRQLPPRGHGPAMELLMREASKQSDALIYLDCDFTYPPSNIPRIRAMLEEGVDVVNASRTWKRPDAMPLPNFLANRTFALTAQAMHGVPTTDLHSGMRGYRSGAIRAFAFSGEGDALPIDTLLWPAKCGFNVVEIPIEYDERVGVSKLRKFTGTVWTFIRLAKTMGVGERRPAHFRHVR